MQLRTVTVAYFDEFQRPPFVYEEKPLVSFFICSVCLTGHAGSV